MLWNAYFRTQKPAHTLEYVLSFHPLTYILSGRMKTSMAFDAAPVPESDMHIYSVFKNPLSIHGFFFVKYTYSTSSEIIKNVEQLLSLFSQDL